MKTLLRCAVFSFSAMLLACLSACQTMDVLSEVGADVAVATGAATPQQGQSIKKVGSAVVKTFESFTPEQEHYIGRTVGAVVVSRYRPLDNEQAHRYLNLLGQTLAQFSDRPETFGGYHFLVLETDDVNAFAAPGGLIFVSRGMIRCCRSEDALAAVLAHEISHVTLRHGMQAIKKGRITSALTIIGAESAKSFGGEELTRLTEAFEGSISDITSTMMNSGYSRAFERDADRAAVTVLQRAGYDPQGLVDMLLEMKKHLKPGGIDFAKTHPSPDSRIKDINNWIGGGHTGEFSRERQVRFQAAMNRI